MKSKTTKRGKNFSEAFAILTKLDRFSSVNQSIGTINTVYSYEFIESFMRDLNLIMPYIVNQDTKMQLLKDREVKNIITRLNVMRDALAGSSLHTKMCKKLDVFLASMPLPQVTTNYNTQVPRRKLIYTSTPTKSSPITINKVNLSYPTPEGGLSRRGLDPRYKVIDDEKYYAQTQSNTLQIVQESREECERPSSLSYLLMLSNTRHQGAQQTQNLQPEEYDRQDRRRLTSLENQNRELLQTIDKLTVQREEYNIQDRRRLTSLENQNRQLLQATDRLTVSMNEVNKRNEDLLRRVEKLTTDRDTSNKHIASLQQDVEYFKAQQNQDSAFTPLIPEHLLRPFSPLPFSPASSLNSTPIRGYNSPSLRGHVAKTPSPMRLTTRISGPSLADKLKAAQSSLS